MAVFVVVLLGIVTLVKSDVGIGYRYHVPVTSYDAPFGSVGNLNNDRKYYHIEKQHYPTGSISPVSPSSQLQTPIHEHGAFLGSINGLDKTGSFSGVTHTTDNNLQHLQTSTQTGGISTFNLLGNSLNKNIASGQNVVVDSKSNFASENSQFKSTVSTGNVALDSKSNFANQDAQQIQVERHLYFYTAPEEPEEVRTRIITPPPPVKKNVKILFIKTPTFNTAPINIPVLPQNEDKTLVYVLVKKPEESSIVIPTATPSKPSKPEVYFIKYKSQKEAHDAISNIQQDGTIANRISTDNSNAFNTDQNIPNQHYTDQNKDINFVSKTSADISGSGVSDSPILVTTPTVPISFEQAGSVDGNGRSGLFSTEASPSTESHSERIFSSDAISNFDGSINNRGHFDSGSTASSLIGPTISSKGSEGINVHQLYGAPSITSKGSEDIQVHQLYGPPGN